MHITLKDKKGRWICEFDTKSVTKLKLGNDHNTYRVHIAKKKIKSIPKDWINCGKCQYWAINTVSNCYIYELFCTSYIIFATSCQKDMRWHI